MNPNLSKRTFALAVTLLFGVVSFGQKLAPKYAGSIQGDVLFGSFENSGSVSILNGVKYQNWTASLGTGLDFYRYRSIPVFIDIQRGFKLRDLNPFVQFSTGINVAHPTNSEKIRDSWWGIWWPGNADTLSFSNGYYSKLGVGLVIPTNYRIKVIATGGWSFKTISEHYQEWVYNGTSGSMKRIQINTGLIVYTWE